LENSSSALASAMGEVLFWGILFSTLDSVENLPPSPPQGIRMTMCLSQLIPLGFKALQLQKLIKQTFL